MRSHNPLLPIAALLLTVMVASACRKDEILVRHILIEPDNVEMMVGGFKRISVSTYPRFADNEGALEFIVENPKVAAFDGVSIAGLHDGKTEILATCGDVAATCQVRVFAWHLTLDNVDYGISKSEGWVNDKGPSDPKELEIKLSHDTGSPVHQFTVWLPVNLVGQKIDLSEPVAGVFVSGTLDGSKDGYGVATMSTEAPRVYHADWSPAEGVTLERGSLLVERKDIGNQFRIKANIRLSNGFIYGAEWEGKLPVSY